MKQPFYSSEIRWFATNRTHFEKLHAQLPGHGIKEPKRTDYYLKTNLIHSGIKIREGKHEIKVKCAPDEQHGLGIIEHWCKWSTHEPNNILNTVDQSLRQEWIPVEKIRWKKAYRIDPVTNSISYQEGFFDDGGNIEFTELKINQSSSNIYTFGLEAFGTHRSCKQNILGLLSFLDLDTKVFERDINMGYPAYLKYHL